MSARLASAAFTVAAAVGATLVPLTAHAAPVGSGTPLTIELGAPAPAGPLTRGGASETFSFTVKNSSDKPVDFQPWLVGDTDGASPIAAKHIVFDVQPVNAPATDEYVSQQGTGAQGVFKPADKSQGSSFSVPAKGELSWKISIGLGKNFPSNNGNLKLTAADLDEHTKPEQDDTLVLETSPKINAAPAAMWMRTDKDAPIKPGLWGNVDLFHQLKGDGTFDTDLATTIEVAEEPGATGEIPELSIEEWIGNGMVIKAEKVPGVQNRWKLGDIPKSYFTDKGKLHRYILRVRVLDFKGIQKPVKLTLRASTSLTEGNTMPFLEAAGRITVAPERGTTPPSAEPSATPTTQPSATPSASVTPSASASAVAVGANTPVTTTGALASTGSSRTTWYAAIAAVALIAAGGVLTALRLRRR
ncbi:LPXTG cell wall anchor domain-containing protein [Streptomyces sp. NPDC019890]|uniref:LPXTG cell wall anchor domain-containing protein n=1 Tax=Streptomyces sp. NPDC019890 TaxID=3365064 RepID=UPI00384CCA70